MKKQCECKHDRLYSSCKEWRCRCPQHSGFKIKEYPEIIPVVYPKTTNEVYKELVNATQRRSVKVGEERNADSTLSNSSEIPKGSESKFGNSENSLEKGEVKWCECGHPESNHFLIEGCRGCLCEKGKCDHSGSHKEVVICDTCKDILLEMKSSRCPPQFESEEMEDEKALLEKWQKIAKKGNNMVYAISTVETDHLLEAQAKQIRIEERERAFSILHTVAMKAKTTEALDLIEEAQAKILNP